MPLFETKRRAAFTLIELALSIFVMGVAVLGVFGLARVGVSAAMEAEDEMRATQFADDVFTTLRLFSDAIQDTGDTNRWETLCNDIGLDLDPGSDTLFSDFWAKLDGDGADFLHLPDFWDEPEGYALGSSSDSPPYPIRMQIVGPDDDYDDMTTTNIFCSADIRGIRGDNDPPLPEYTIRYRLVIVTNSSSYVSANLNVWCGLDSRRRNDYTFYTHFFERRRLP